MDGTIIQQGQFTSTGVAVTLPIRSGVDWIEVYNYTEATAANASHGVSYYWQLGMTAGDAIVNLRNAAANAINTSTAVTLGVGGFTLVDSSNAQLGAPRAITSVSAVGLVLTANTTNVSVGSLVMLSDAIGALQVCGIVCTVTAVNPGVSFTIRVPSNMVLAAAPGAGAVYRIVPFPLLFQPQELVVSNVSQAVNAVITTFQNHNYVVGQEIRLAGFQNSGMTQAEGVQGSVTAVTASTITTDINSSAWTAFAFPLTGALPVTLPQVIPFGENTATALAAVPQANILADATNNTGFIGVVLAAGITSPAGSNNDVVFWKAGKSFNT